MKSEIETFDGLDNRKTVLLLLERLGSDRRRKRFLESLVRLSLKGFSGCEAQVMGPCDAVRAYFILSSICNEIGVSIDAAARMLEAKVKQA